MKRIFTILLSSNLMAVTAQAEPQPACHRLMTERECTDHVARLASLPAGETLQRYLSEFASERKEREIACRCQNDATGWSRLHAPRQVLLRF